MQRRSRPGSKLAAIIIGSEVLSTSRSTRRVVQKRVEPRHRYRQASLLAAAVVGVAGCMAPSLVRGAAVSWDNGAGASDLRWSTATNWNADDSDLTGDDITITTNASGTVGTVTNIVDLNVSVLSLTYGNTGTNYHTTQINQDRTLTVTTSFQLNPSTSSSTSKANITGLGALSIGNGTGSSFSVGVSNVSTSGTTNTLDMSGLASFSANVGNFYIGTGQRNNGIVTLGTTNAITATTVQLGGNTSTGGNQSILDLGQTNTIYADTIAAGNGRSSGWVRFRAGLTGATVTIANRANSGGVNVNLGLLDTNASGGTSGTLDFGGGTLYGTFATINLGRGSTTSSGSSSGFFTFGAGVMSATTMNIGYGYNNSSNASSSGNGTFAMTASAGDLTATTVYVGRQSNSGALAGANGTFSQNGGTAQITTLTIGERTSTTASGNVTGTYSLAGGTLKAQTIQPGSNGSGAGTVTRTFNWSGGTIQNLNTTTDLTVNSAITLTLNAGTTKSFNPDQDRTVIVNGVIAGSNEGFSKTGSGTLNLAGANTYSGATTITAGNLVVSGTGAINNSSGLTINGTTARYIHTSSVASSVPITVTTGVLDGTGSVGAVTVGNNVNSVVTNGNGTTTAFTLSSLSFDGAGKVTLRATGSTTAAGLIVTNALTLNGSPAAVSINIEGAGGTWAQNTTYKLIKFGTLGGQGLAGFALGTLTGISPRTVKTLGVSGEYIELSLGGTDAPKWTGLDSADWRVGATGANGNWKLITSATSTDYIETDIVLFDDSAAATTVAIDTANVIPGGTTFNNVVKTYTLSSSTGKGITGSGGLTKEGTGTLNLNTANTYAGGTTFIDGTINVGNAAALGNGPVAINTGSAKVIDNMSGGNLTMNGITSIALNDDLTFAGTNNLSLGNGTVTLGGTGTSRTISVSDKTLSVGVMTSSAIGVTKSGSGTLIINTPNFASSSVIGGVLTVDSGTFQFNTGADANTTGDFTAAGLSGSGTIINGGGVERWFLVNTPAASTHTFTGVLANGGTGALGLRKLGAGTQVLSQASTHTGPTTIDGGVLRLDHANAVQNSTVALNVAEGLRFGSGITTPTIGGLSGSGNLALTNVDSTAVVLSVGNNYANTTYSGALSGAGSFIKDGTGIATLTGSSSHAGGTTVNAGTLVIMTGQSWTGGTQVNNSATLAFNSTSSAGGAVAGEINLANGATVNTLPAGTTANPSVFIGSNLVLATGATATATSAAIGNGYGGEVIGDATSVLSVKGQTSFSASATSTYPKQFQTMDGTVRVESGATLRFSATNMANGGDNTTFDVLGSLTTRNGGDVALGALTGSGTIRGANNADGTGVFAVGAKGSNTTFSGTIVDGSSTRQAAFIKVGTGTLTLTGTNTYSGSTTIDNGTLALSGTASIANSPTITVGGGATLDVSGLSNTFTLASTQKLKGVGTVKGSMIVNGSIAPGSSPGTIFTDALTLEGGSNYEFEINNAEGTAGASSGWDLISVTGGVTINATSSNKVTIKVFGLNGTNPGTIANRQAGYQYVWKIAEGTTAITGFDPAAFAFDLTNWTNNNYAGTWSVKLSSDSKELHIVYVPEPTSLGVVFGMGLLTLRRRKRL